MTQKKSILSTVLTVLFTIISIIYVMPIFEVVINSFKSNAYVNMDTFAFPNEESFVGFANYVKGASFKIPPQNWELIQYATKIKQ